MEHMLHEYQLFDICVEHKGKKEKEHSPNVNIQVEHHIQQFGFHEQPANKIDCYGTEPLFLQPGEQSDREVPVLHVISSSPNHQCSICTAAIEIKR